MRPNPIVYLPQSGKEGRAFTMSQTNTESGSAKLFDLRSLIGGLFVLYGIILIVAGALVSSAARHKAAGININLWMGIGMLVLGVLFLLWWRLNPLDTGDEPAARGRSTAK
jgi:hypothetical protein